MGGYHFAMSLLVLFGFIVTYAAIPVFRKVAISHDVISAPGGRRSHLKPTPLLGGLAIFLPFAAAFISFFFLVCIGLIVQNQPNKIQMLSLFLGTAWI